MNLTALATCQLMRSNAEPRGRMRGENHTFCVSARCLCNASVVAMAAAVGVSLSVSQRCQPAHQDRACCMRHLDNSKTCHPWRTCSFKLKLTLALLHVRRSCPAPRHRDPAELSSRSCRTRHDSNEAMESYVPGAGAGRKQVCVRVCVCASKRGCPRRGVKMCTS